MDMRSDAKRWRKKPTAKPWRKRKQKVSFRFCDAPFLKISLSANDKATIAYEEAEWALGHELFAAVFGR